MAKHLPGCPNSDCQSHQIRRDGFYFRKNDSRRVQRFKCLACGKKFSRATFEWEYRQKKRRVNFPLLKLLSSGVSQRRSALILGVDKKTVERKFLYLAKKIKERNQKWRDSLESFRIEHIQFDDLISIEHTKLKPLTVTAVTDSQTREILTVKVGKIPSFGLLAKLSRIKYGFRENQHPETLRRAFKEIKDLVHPKAIIDSDEHMLYPSMVREFFPDAKHRRYKSERSAISGQGELKKTKYDPLWDINHTYAMLRGNVNRLFRKTWCTTKIAERLEMHLEIFQYYFNYIYL